MKAQNTTASWGWVARLFHWGMAGLILFQFGLGVWMTRDRVDLLTRFDLTQIHKSWGVLIFGLALARLAWRLANRMRPALPADMPCWQRRAARASHVALYVLMLVLPLSGWVQAAAAPEQDILGIENRVFGTFALPDPWQPGVASIAEAAGAVHSSCAWTLAALLLVHAGAALLHQFRARDGVLARMIFG